MSEFECENENCCQDISCDLDECLCEEEETCKFECENGEGQGNCLCGEECGCQG